MHKPSFSFRRLLASGQKKSVCLLLVVGGSCVDLWAQEQPRGAISAERAAQALKQAVEAEARQYHMRYGPVYFRAGAGVRLGYTDNVFYSEQNRSHDFLINPEVNLGAFMQVSEYNMLRLSLGLGYEYYIRNDELNGDGPLVNPDTELAFNIFVGDARIRLREKFSYQESLFYNSSIGRQDLIYNFTDVGEFSRWHNLVGFNVDYDLRKVMLTVGYDHENFTSMTDRFDYMTRGSELFNASAAYLVGDNLKVGPELQASYHNFDDEITLNDHWRGRAGPFVDFRAPQGITFRAGGGYDAAWFASDAEDSDVKTYYAYGRISQEARFFTHSVSGGREHLLGDNANNLKTTFVRYSISSPIIHHVELGANASAHFAEEFGGDFQEDFDYYVLGCSIGYQIHKYWRTDLAYQFLLKDSELALRDYHRNRVTLSLSFTF